ncbi:hypothetical protein V6N11_067289 [Hibiscus sabdariffa]|uniref:RRM domain-containing protein n=1 Tax=Hibiscus sabdariffa TaxID=183260 RepID=A0ABR2SR50_9ROSI
MASSPSQLSLKQLRDFHNMDRIIYSRLLTFDFDPLPCMKIVAFWNTLEKFGFRNLVYGLQQLCDSRLLSVAKESIFCLQCLCSPSQEIFPWLHLDFSHLNRLLPQHLLLGFLVKNRAILKRMIQGFVEDVCQVAFLDILQQNQAPPPTPTDDKGGVSKDKTESSDLEDKTLFMTFSRGHPVSDHEIHGFIVRKFGSCVEAIHMDKNPKCLFACVALRSQSDMSKILGGEKLVRLFINGKQVRVRRSIGFFFYFSPSFSSSVQLIQSNCCNGKEKTRGG